MRAAEPVGVLVGDDAFAQQPADFRLVPQRLGLPRAAAPDFVTDIAFEALGLTSADIVVASVWIGEGSDVGRVRAGPVGGVVGVRNALRGAEQSFE